MTTKQGSWDGKQIVLASPGGAPKARVIKTGDRVAITIDSNEPAKVLLIRGTVEVTMIDGMVPEYALAAERHNGKEAVQAWVDQFTQMGIKQMVHMPSTRACRKTVS